MTPAERLAKSGNIVCPSCRGSGLTTGGDGNPMDCGNCYGDGYVRARDARGRFAVVGAPQ